MSAKAVYEKLRLTEHARAVVLNAPGDYEEIIGELPINVTVSTSVAEKAKFVHLFVMDQEELDKYIDAALDAVEYDGLFWISYPKGSSKVKTDINRDTIWEGLKQKDIRPVTQISINDTWSALRFRPKDAVGT